MIKNAYASFRLWFALHVEEPFVIRFGTVEECGCAFFMGKQRFICVAHFLGALEKRRYE